MPGLIQSAPARRCRIFVSYAHQDALPPKDQPLGHSLLARFQLELKNLRTTLAADHRVLHEDEVFIDTERLNAAPVWRPAIQRAVQECDLMIFLISPDARVSDFCIQYEVGPAAQRGVPVVPVLLRETAHWTKLSLGPQRLLGDFHSAGLPKNDIGNAMPICSDAWGDVDKAWRRMTEHLTEFIAHQLFGPGSRMPAHQAALPAAGAGLPVTYFCDQLPATGDFDNVLDSHHQQQHPDQLVHALLAIVQGQYDDNPDMFVNRLHAHHLSHRLQALGLSIDPIRRPMEWPMHSNAADTFDGKTAVRQLFDALDSRLSVALARCTTMAHASTALRDHLARDDTKARVVFALLPDRSARSVAALHALATCIDGCLPTGNEMAKLTLFCIDEQAGARAAWAKLLPGPKRLRAVVLRPLQPFDASDLRQWHTRYGLEGQWRWSDCLALFKQIAHSPRPGKLHLREWVEAVRQRHPHIDSIYPAVPTLQDPQ